MRCSFQQRNNLQALIPITVHTPITTMQQQIDEKQTKHKHSHKSQLLQSGRAKKHSSTTTTRTRKTESSRNILSLDINDNEMKKHELS